MSHAACGPSALSRRMACLGSLEAEKGLPDESSKYAEEGTTAHTILEQTLTGQPIDISKLHEYPDMDAAVNEAVQWTRGWQNQGYELYCETQVNPEPFLGRSDCWGTADIILVKEDHLIVADYKHGQGVGVDVIENKQLLAYAAGGVAKYYPFSEPKTVTMVIIQPRFHSGPAVQTWAISYDDACLRWGAMANTLKEVQPGAVRTPGECCQWCRARMDCPARLGKFEEASKEAFALINSETGTIPLDESLTRISNRMISDILDSAPILLGFLDDMKHLAQIRIEGGENVPGHKLVRGRSNRTWAYDPDTMAKKFKAMKLNLDDWSPRKMGTPASVEKCGKLTDKQHTNLAKLWENKPGKLRLVVDTAKGEAITFDSKEAFNQTEESFI